MSGPTEQRPQGDDWQARERAVAALAASPSLEARSVLEAALFDGVRQVRMVALDGLVALGQASPSLGLALAATVLTRLDASAVPAERASLVRALVTLGAGLALEPLRERRERAESPEEAEAWVVALAALGDADARRQVLVELTSSEGARLRRWLVEHAASLGGAWLLPGLAPLLDRREPLVFMGHGADPEELSVRDVAGALVARLVGLRVEVPLGDEHARALASAARHPSG